MSTPRITSGAAHLRHILGVSIAALMLSLVSTAQAQLRIVAYNTLNKPRDAASDLQFETIASAIGNTARNGISKRVDVFALQEQSNSASTQSADTIVEILNDLYGVTSYEARLIDNVTQDFVGVVYDSSTVEFLSEQFISTAGPRDTYRGQFRPVGYSDPGAEFYVYSSHFSSSGGSSTRAAEGLTVSNNAAGLGLGANTIFAGDFNFGSDNEAGYANLLATSNDPLGLPSWPNSSVAEHLTQSTRTTNLFDGGATGGNDDRFDLQLVSDNLLDGEGLSYLGPTSTGLSSLTHSYHAFGNDGVSYDQAINNVYTGRSQSASVLDALHDFSDHLPVVADYQLPAVMSAQLASMPGNVPQGATVNVDVLVENIANVIAAAGADELDYTISVSGDLSGAGSGTSFALAGANSHPIGLDTATTGNKSGVITVSSSSQAAGNALVNIPVSFTVGQVNSIPFLAKDDFDNPMGLISFAQSPAAGAFTSPGDGFERYQVGVSPSIPFQLVDDSNNGNPTDTRGIVDTATKTDGWFGITDTVNDDNPTVNPSGVVSATWEFDIEGATGLQVSIDVAAMGDFEASETAGDFFNFTYSIDGSPEQDLFISSVNEDGSATYTLADGDMFTLDDPLSMENNAGQMIELSNVFQTLSSVLGTDGDVLTINLKARTDGSQEEFAFDTLEVSGITIIVGADDADFNGDNIVDGTDLLTWQAGFGSGTVLAEGDANGDGTVDALDLAIWRQQYGQVQQNSVQAVPEPSALCLILGAALLLGQAKNKGETTNHKLIGC